MANHQLPIHRDDAGDLASDCCPRPGGLKELHKIHRTLPALVINSYSEDFLQMEDLSPVLDEQNNGTIFDNFKQ